MTSGSELPAVLGIVGARSGSKGIPDKNITPLAGKPLMGWIIEAALDSKHVNRVIVSTDSPEYAAIARAHGAEVPFLRPEEFATDTSPERDYIQFVLQWLRENEGYEPDIVVRLVPTSPFQSADDIDQCVQKLLNDPKADTAVVVAQARQHPLKAFTIRNNALVPYCTKKGNAMIFNRQECAPAYFRANVVACRMETITSTGYMYGNHVVPHIIPQERALDIDNAMDFVIAEMLIESNGT